MKLILKIMLNVATYQQNLSTFNIFFCLSRCEVLVALSEILSKICQTEGKYTALCDLTHKYGNIN